MYKYNTGLCLVIQQMQQLKTQLLTVVTPGGGLVGFNRILNDHRAAFFQVSGKTKMLLDTKVQVL